MNFAAHIVLENSRVRLELLAQKHFADLRMISRKHPNLLQYSPSPFGDDDSLEKYVQAAISAWENQQRYPFAILDKESGKYVGSTSYGNISLKDRRLEIGWTWIAKDLQGTGLNQACKTLLLTYAFQDLGMERVELKTDIRNLQSRKAIEKIGGIYEGVLRSHTLMPDGHRRDTVYYSILREEWEKRK